MPYKRASVGRLEVIAFLGGASVMALEITGSRVLAPYLGTSVFVWTNLIGVIMASLSLGYWWGGRMADQHPTFQRLAIILALAATFSGITAVWQQPVLAWLESAGLELRLSALAATLLLFAPASTLLGMVTPFVARLKLDSLTTAGSEVGRLYAISTAGSIAGTFAAGYFLLGMMGSSRILYGIAATIGVLSFVAAGSIWVRERSALLVMLVLAAMLAEYERAGWAKAGVLDFDTAYQRVFVIDTVEPESGRPVRLLRAEQSNTQSAIYLDSTELVGDYLQCFHRATANHPSLNRVLMIGAAGYAFPSFQLEFYPELQVDVVEIDPAMTDLAQRYFRLKPNPRLNTIHADGRIYVSQTEHLYDAILIDAFQTRTPPFQLLTVEFARKLNARLQPGGIVVLNLIAVPAGTPESLASSIYTTFQTVFPVTRLMRVDASLPVNKRQNLVLVASKGELPPMAPKEPGDLAAFIDTTGWSGLVLRDDFAPVEVLGN